MRIGIDARSIHHEGVGRYIRELIKHLSRIDHKNEYIVYFSSQESITKDIIESSNFHGVFLPVTIYDLHKQPYLWYRIHRDRLDVFHATDHWLVPFFSPCPLIITVHDTLVKTERKSLPYKVLVYGAFITRIALAVSDKILTISDFTKKEIFDLYPRAGKKISVIYHGVGPEFRPVPETPRVRNKYRLTKKYFLYVGSLKSHKNIPRLIEAFSRLPSMLREETDLVIAARLEPRFSETERLPARLGIEESVKFTGYVPNTDLPELYNGAIALIIPSFTEWFGLPVIEAMSCGTPVIASKGGALPEVGGEAALYFDPESTDNLKSTIERVLIDNDLRKRLSNMGLKRSKDFSWNTTARRTLEIYEEVCKQ